jgi:uncharacterized membrane protein
MGNFGAGGWLVMGIVLLVLGFLVRSSLFEFLLDFTGLILIVIGIIAIVVGLISMITGRGQRSGGF